VVQTNLSFFFLFYSDSRRLRFITFNRLIFSFSYCHRSGMQMRGNENNKKKYFFLDENWFEHLNGTENGAVTHHKIRNSEVFSRLAFSHFVTNEHGFGSPTNRQNKTKNFLMRSRS